MTSRSIIYIAFIRSEKISANTKPLLTGIYSTSGEITAWRIITAIWQVAIPFRLKRFALAAPKHCGK
jgi:hypothetical protein